MSPFRVTCGVLILFLIGSFLQVMTYASKAKVNILFLMADQLRSDAVGCYGNKLARTPNLDWLSENGAQFEKAYTSTPSCTPARAAILTGLSPWYHGMLGYGVIADRYPLEMPRTFSSSGYYAYSIGKDHFGWNNTADAGIAHGYNATNIYDGLTNIMDDYDQWFAKVMPGVDPQSTGLGWNEYRGRTFVFPEYYHPTAYVGRKTVEFLQTYNRSEPFFFKSSFHRPHSPYDPPGRLAKMFTPSEMPKPYLSNTWDADCDFEGSLPSALCCGHIDEGEVAISRQMYYANVAFVDEWIGKIIETLRNQSLLDNTIILFTADHGDMLGDHYRWRKILPYESSSKVPMILWWPPSFEKKYGGIVGVARGTRKMEVVELRDIFPTFLRAADLPIPSSLNGSALFDLLRGDEEPTKWRSYLGLEHTPACNATFHWSALTDGKVKYIFRAAFSEEQLFDLVNDPHEMTNLAHQPAWQSTLLAWRQRLVDQFVFEERGEHWLINGILQRRVKAVLYSPHYPGKDTSCLDSHKFPKVKECSWF